MTFTPHLIAVALIGLLHVFFTFAELFPWRSPLILKAVINKWPKPLVLDSNGKNLMAMIVHNAGIYNGIVAAALFVALLAGPEALPIQISLLIGGIVAGIFGALTLSPLTIVQVILGAIALAVVIASPQ